ncbi:acyl--CoA ligase [Actinomyces sp. B33]|uniref:class I adenylate-forming enzyme family protein n=1 Tax=Actinomyces sp. B33 TaxID=2942131 RepID=UPI00234008DB|nr:class I adenylate-forming enzyme family protein [Actinomyces sp. B33]MDC4232988.1 acyl--CoA ligase [Actinomyces sp. B33]
MRAVPDCGPARALVRAAEQHPHRLSLVDVGADRTWTVGEAAVAVRRTATVLSEAGIGPGDRVAVVAPNSAWHFLVHLACAWIGAVTVPLSDRLPALQVVERVEAAGARLVVGERVDAPGGIRFLALAELSAAVDGAAAIEGDPPSRCYETAAILFTSGTTGRARPVELSHSMLWWGSTCFRDGFEYSPARDIVGVCAPMSHIGGFNGTSLDVFSHGGTVVLLPGFDARAILRAIERHRISMMFVVPTMCHALLDALDEHGGDVSSWTRPLVGGDALSPALDARMRAHGLAPIHVWGMTETCGAGAMLAPDSPGPSGSIGRPFPYVDLRVVDAHGAPCPSGAIGEIQVRGPGVVTGDEWLGTGDLGSVDAHGWVSMVGRAARMINTGGELVAPARVEQALVGLEGIRAALVVGLPDERWGQVVAAVVVADRGADGLDPRVLARELAGVLAPWETVRRVEAVEALPLTANGKPDPAAAVALLTP